MKKLALCLLLAACSKTTSTPTPPSHVDITVTEKGFEPRDVSVPAGVPVTIIFKRTTDKTCATDVVVDTGTEKIQKALPLNTPVEIAATFPKAGKLGYACGMNMMKGTITVQ